MDAFLTSLFALALVQIGDRPQILCAVLAMRYRRVMPVIAGLALATLANCLISAIGGSVVNEWISEDPLRLFYALSLIFAGVGMLWWRRPLDQLEKWTIGPFWTSFIGIFILQLGDKGQFIIAATAARTDMWAFAAIGGWIGVMAACLPAVLLQDKLAAVLPATLIRRLGGAVLLFIGSAIALTAWGII